MKTIDVPPAWFAFIVWTFVLAAIALVVGIVARACVIWKIKSAVQHAPKVPMEMCDKQHVYPMADALIVRVPEITDPIHLCPFCYRENLSKAAEPK
jgi:hypothetical protein